MIKDNPKHHKYTDVNKYERKKKKINATEYPLKEHNFTCLKPIYCIYDYFYNYITNKLRPNYIDLRIGYRPCDYSIYYRYQQASHKLVWNDANHTTCRILIKKQKGYSFVTERPFKGINDKPSITVFDRFDLFKWIIL